MNDNLKINQAGLDLIKEFEGYHEALPNGDCKAYLDRLPRVPVWTIGYGCTDGVYEGLVWTKPKAEKELRNEVEQNAFIVKRVIKVPLNENQFSALNSFSYNMIGGISPTRHRTLVNAVNAQDWEAAEKAFGLYVNSGGKPYNGLIRRRRMEAKLFSTPVKQEVVENSSKLSALKTMRDTIALSLPTGGVADYLGYMEPIKTYILENPYKLVAFFLVVLWLLSKWIEKKTVKDAQEGRYIPSGMAKTEDELDPAAMEGSNTEPDDEPTA